MENLRIFIAVIFTFYLAGCSSSDDSDPGNPEPKRTEIIMETPTQNEDINWDNAKLVFSEEFDGSSVVEDFWNFEIKFK